MPQEPEQKAEETQVEENVEVKPEDTASILKEIRDRIGAPAKESPAAGPTAEQVRAAVKERTGFTDEQLDHSERVAAMKVAEATAPLKEKLAWSELKEKVGPIEADVKAEMDKELAQYPAINRGDPVLIEKVYFMALGHSSYRRAGAQSRGETVKDENVTERRVVIPGSGRGLASGGAPAKSKVSDEERALYSKFGIKDDAEWERHKNTRVISDLRTK